jgi:hypothetical protein
LLREMVGFTAQRLMELEAESLTGAPYGKRSEDRVNQPTAFATALGKPVPAPSNWLDGMRPTPSCAMAVTFRLPGAPPHG